MVPFLISTSIAQVVDTTMLPSFQCWQTLATSMCHSIIDNLSYLQCQKVQVWAKNQKILHNRNMQF
uniref:Uncharacterized protein n=1 Tax=Rhizophora mucronata TaxID=61149 RepID=A0A2P2QS94_RHIMU